MTRRRLIIGMIGGRIVVRDRTRPAAELVALDLGDGRTAMIAPSLCAWHADRADDAPWPDEAAARAALADADDGWAQTLAAAAALVEGTPPAPLPRAEDAALLALGARHPGAWIDGPSPSADGGWQVVLTGTSDLGWLLGTGPTPVAAARDLLARAARRTAAPDAPEPLSE